MKHLKNINDFFYISENFEGTEKDKIHYNSGAYSIHLNFDIGDINKIKPFIYPGAEFTTSSDGNGKVLLEKFVEAIEKHDLSEIKEFRNGKKTFFDEKVWVVSCGTNNLNIREIPKEISKFTLFKPGPYDTNYLNEKQFELTKPVAELEGDKIYTAFNFTDYNKEYTGIIDVTEEVKNFVTN